MEMFVFDKEKSLEFIDALIRDKVDEIKNYCSYAKEWLDEDYKIYINENGQIEVYSFLNLPDEVEDLILNKLNGQYK
jgi:hypothetical protein